LRYVSLNYLALSKLRKNRIRYYAQEQLRHEDVIDFASTPPSAKIKSENLQRWHRITGNDHVLAEQSLRRNESPVSFVTKATIVIFALVFAILFIMLFYATDTTTNAGRILTRPLVSEEEAARLVEEHLRDHYKDFIGYHIFTSGEGYETYSEYKALGQHLPLTFTHKNGTLFYVDNLTYEIYGSCTISESSICKFNPNYVNETRDSLAYFFDLAVSSYCSMPEIVIVDATNGGVLYSSASERPEIFDPDCLQ